MLIFKMLHILSMFAAVTVRIGDSFFPALAFWRRGVLVVFDDEHAHMLLHRGY